MSMKNNKNLPPIEPNTKGVYTKHTGKTCAVCGAPKYGIYRQGVLEVEGCPNEDRPAHWKKEGRS